VRKSRVTVNIVKVSNVRERWTRCRKGGLPLLSLLKVVVSVNIRGEAMAKPRKIKKRWRGKEDANQRLRKRIATKGFFVVWRGLNIWDDLKCELFENSSVLGLHFSVKSSLISQNRAI
jgi:hypothetical protein